MENEILKLISLQTDFKSALLSLESLYQQLQFSNNPAKIRKEINKLKEYLTNIDSAICGTHEALLIQAEGR